MPGSRSSANSVTIPAPRIARINGTTWAAKQAATKTGVTMAPRPVRTPRAKSPTTTKLRASERENAYSPARVEKRLPPSMVNDASKRNGSVAAARAAGIGGRSRKSRPITNAHTGIRIEPVIVASLKASW